MKKLKRLFLTVMSIPIFGQVGINIDEGTLPQNTLHVKGTMRVDTSPANTDLSTGNWILVDSNGDLTKYSTNTGQLANRSGQLYVQGNIKEVTANYTIAANDETILSKGSSNVTVTLPDPTLAENKGRTLIFKAFGEGNITLSSTANIRLTSSQNLTKVLSTESAMLRANATSGVWEVIHYNN